mmetsp:Transcript_4737/g.8564  ORF Transcript_4737/g.8564 Transcript_4737/m.8564 type:complete len:202 (+) Transcript_4737:304-909(+)
MHASCPHNARHTDNSILFSFSPFPMPTLAYVSATPRMCQCLCVCLCACVSVCLCLKRCHGVNTSIIIIFFLPSSYTYPACVSPAHRPRDHPCGKGTSMFCCMHVSYPPSAKHTGKSEGLTRGAWAANCYHVPHPLGTYRPSPRYLAPQMCTHPSTYSHCVSGGYLGGRYLLAWVPRGCTGRCVVHARASGSEGGTASAAKR